MNNFDKLNTKFEIPFKIKIMKKLFPLAAFLFFINSQAISQTADEIISKHIEAIGGKERLLTLNTAIMDGILSVQGAEIPLKIFQANNKGSRVQIDFMGMSGYIINTMTEGWTFLPFQGQAAPEAMAADLVKEGADQLDIQGALLNYTEKGHKVEYLGKEDFEGTECFKLKINFKGGSESTMFFDPANYYVIKLVTKSKAGGQESEQVQTFSNYQKTPEGFVFPMAMTGFGPGEVSFSKIEINAPIDDSKFKKAN